MEITEKELRELIRSIIDETTTSDNAGAYKSKYSFKASGSLEENNKQGVTDMPEDNNKDYNVHYFRKNLNEYMNNTEFSEKKPHQKIGIITKAVLDDIRSIDSRIQQAVELKKDGGITQKDLWKWTPQHVDEIERKLRKLAGIVQKLKR